MEDHLIAVLTPAVEVDSRSYDIYWSEYSRDSGLIFFGILINLSGVLFLSVFTLGRRNLRYRFPVVFAKARTDIEKLRIESFDGACLFGWQIFRQRVAVILSSSGFGLFWLRLNDIFGQYS